MKNWLIGAAAVLVGGIAMLHPPAPKQNIVAQAAPARPHRKAPAGAGPAAVLVVYVAGSVVHPGIYRLPAGSRAVDALKLAGGFGTSADPAGVNLAEVLADGEEIAVPVAGESRSRRVRSARTRKASRAAKTVPAVAVDLNTAGVAALMQLPGVGKALADRVVRFREVNGPFASIDELADVAGMTPRRIESLTPYVRITR